MARGFSDTIAGAFQENGVSIDKEGLHQSVLTAVDQGVAKYAEFIKSNKEYADISGPEEEWLRKDSAYMASELRKTMADIESPPIGIAQNVDGFSLNEMEKMYHFTKELKSYSTYVSGNTKAVLTGNESEESLGMKLADLTLKGKVFNDYANVSDKVKKMVNQSITNFVTTAIEKEQAYMDKWSELQIQAVNKSAREGALTAKEADKTIEEIKKSYTAIDKNAIYMVIDKVLSSYDRAGDVNKALMDGAVFAKNAYEEKAKDHEYSGIRRYDSGAGYWNNFFSNKDKYDGKTDSLGFKRPYDGHKQKESGLDGIINTWNDFMSNVSSDSVIFMSKPYFSAMV